jgi:hypothetical protein
MRSEPKDRMHWIGVLVRAFFGALLGLGVGLSLIWWWFDAGPWWIVVPASVVICAVLSARYGDDFWTNVKDWL